MMAAIRGFMPPVERRLSIAMRSGKTAKVVPRPATKPNMSDRWKLGSRMLSVFLVSSSHPESIKSWLSTPAVRVTLEKRGHFIAAVSSGGISADLTGSFGAGRPGYCQMKQWLQFVVTEDL